MENVNEITAHIQEVSEATRDNITEAFHLLCSNKSSEHSMGMSEVTDIIIEEFEGVVIPEEESEELRARAAKDGKTFQELVIEYVNRGLADDADCDRARRVAGRNGELGGSGRNTSATLMN